MQPLKRKDSCTFKREKPLEVQERIYPLAAAVRVLGPEAMRDVRDYRPLGVMNVALVMIDGKPALEAVLWNRSETAHPLTSLELSLSERKAPWFAAQMVMRVYEISAEAEVESTRRLSLHGSAGPLEGKEARHRVLYPIQGTLFLDGGGRWSLQLVLPVREELAPGKALALALKVPSSFRIASSKQQHISPPPLSSYTIGDPPTELRLLELLRKTGLVHLVVAVSHSGSERATCSGSVDFGVQPGRKNP
jgi:hypothetical protein